jgi:hypothetical protein
VAGNLPRRHAGDEADDFQRNPEGRMLINDEEAEAAAKVWGHASRV